MILASQMQQFATFVFNYSRLYQVMLSLGYLRWPFLTIAIIGLIKKIISRSVLELQLSIKK